MNRAKRLSRMAALCLIAAPLGPSASAELSLPRDGWVSWQVPAVDDAPDWCCWSDAKATDATERGCRLDRRREGYNSRGDATTDSIRLYARFSAGKVERLRALAATCPVQTATEVQDLGAVPVDDSARWLAALVRQGEQDVVTRHQVGEDVIAALAIHRGEIAFEALAELARTGQRDKQRERAVFWLAHLRGLAGADIATELMFGDPDADVREHAAFAVALSKSPRAATDLIRLANTDREAAVRSQAWFWLAHTGSAATEEAIGAALRKEADAGVRKHAIFALSRLPDERATRALISAAEDPSLSREERKRAVFWLSQSRSSAALDYLDEMLGSATAHR